MSRDLITNSLFAFPSVRFPSFWEDENWMTNRGSVSGLNVYETESEVVVEAAVPGINPEDVEITFEKGVLRITGQRKSEERDDRKHYHSSMSSSYSYQVALPVDVDQNAEPEAQAENGVMVVKFAKAKASMPKKISVKSNK